MLSLCLNYETSDNSERQAEPSLHFSIFLSSVRHLDDYGLKPCYGNISVHPNHLEGQLKHKLLGSNPRISASEGLG